MVTILSGEAFLVPLGIDIPRLIVTVPSTW